MKTLKIIGLVLVVIIVLLLIIPLFINGNYSVEREVTINKPKQEVFDYVKYLKNQNKFSVWAKNRPSHENRIPRRRCYCWICFCLGQ